MGCWQGEYFLKSETKSFDLWEFVRNMLGSFELPEKMPSRFSYETETDFFWWADKAELTEFHFVKNSREQHDELFLRFYKKIENLKAGAVHRLVYAETAKSGNLLFCDKFFASIKQLVPKKYTKLSITDDKIETKKLIDKKNLGEIDFFLPNLIEEFKKERVYESLPVLEFLADDEGKFFFPAAWLDRLAEDLWFVDAQIKKIYGIWYLISSRDLTEQIVKKLKRKQNQYITKALLIKDLKVNCEKLFEDSEKFFGTGSKIQVISSSKNRVEIDEEIFSGAADEEARYEKLKAAIVNSVGTESCEYALAADLKTEAEFEDKLEAYKKSLGLDEKNIVRISEDLEKARQENSVLEKENSTLKAKCSELGLALQKAASESSALPADGKAGADDSELRALLEKNGSLRQKIKELEEKVKLLRAEKERLESRVRLFENKVADSGEVKNFYALQLPCSKKELFENEITDFLYDLLYEKLGAELNSIPENKKDEIFRKRDVVTALLAEKEFDKAKTVSAQKQKNIKDILKSANKDLPLEKLKSEGFKESEAEGRKHKKLYFYDERYLNVFSGTPSDEKVAENKFKEISERCFL